MSDDSVKSATARSSAATNRPPAGERPTVDPVVLVVDDNDLNRKLLTAVFTASHFDVTSVDSGEAALARIAAAPPSVVILDLHMPGINGLETLRRIKLTAPDLPVIMLTSHGEIASAIEATRLGAYDFLTRPIHNDQVVMAVLRAVEHRRLLGEVHALRCKITGGDTLAKLEGQSEGMRRVVRQIRQVAPSALTVLIQGETGTGKELAARAIHQQSERVAGPFVAIDCGAISETLMDSELFGYEKGAFTGATQRKLGQFQLAEGGTIFLDETANLTLGLQAKLLRVLQERQVQPLGAVRAYPIDVRVIAATHERLDAQVSNGTFRQDLYFRLAEFTLALPPLRDRHEDIVPLARRLLADACSEMKRPAAVLSDAAADVILQHPWNGNVRELRNAMRNAVLCAADSTIQVEDIEAVLHRRTSTPPTPRSTLPPPAAGVIGGRSLKEIADTAANEAERLAIAEALQSTGNNKTQAAKLLKVDYKTLYNKLKRHGFGAL
jgi:DNA-binding NtrC family response regulator